MAEQCIRDIGSLLILDPVPLSPIRMCLQKRCFCGVISTVPHNPTTSTHFNQLKSTRNGYYESCRLRRASFCDGPQRGEA
jgi:hypothetical protein